MKALTIVLIISVIAIVGIVVSLDSFVSSTNDVIQLSVNAQTSPNGVKIHTLQQLSDIDSGTTILDNSTLDKLPVLKNAIDQAFSKYVPSPSQGVRSFLTQISKSEADSIMQLAGNKVNQLPETQTNDVNFGVNFTSYTYAMDFKLNNFYYHVVIERLVPS
jgi:hypothetical protein